MRSRPSLPAALLTVVFAAAGTALAQDPVVAVAEPAPAPPSVCAQFDVVSATVQYIAPVRVANGDLTFGVEFAGIPYNVVLWPHDVRAPGFRLMVSDAAGVHQVPTPPSVTYRGTLLEDPASWCSASVIASAVTAIVHLGNGVEWAIQPVASAPGRGGAAQHIVFRRVDSTNSSFHCGVNGPGGSTSSPIAQDVARVCEIAIHADVQYYQQNGSNLTNTQNDVTNIINNVSAIYTNDVQISYTITQILVDTVSSPFTSSVAGTLLGQFQADWNANHTGIHRDVAHLFTGRPMGQASGGAIGIAFLSTICSLSQAYGVSQSRWTNNITGRVAVTAHELGHCFSATHCDANNPCNIMCSAVFGCSNNATTFSQLERNQILNFAQTASCVAIVPNQPVITGATPTHVQAFQPGIVQLSGSGFVGTTQVNIGGTVLTSGFSATNDTSLSIPMPAPTTLGPVSITTTNSAGTSNPITVTYDATSPCKMITASGVLGGTTLNWQFAGQPGDLWALLTSPSNTTTTFQGLTILDNADLFAIGLLDPVLGFGNYSVFVPAGTFAGQTYFSQIGELLYPNPVLTAVSSSAIRSTLVVN